MKTEMMKKMKMKMMTEGGEAGSERGRERKSERREGRKKEERRRGKTQTWIPNTYALARTTLKIINGCLCRGTSRRFQGVSRFQHAQKKRAQRLDSLVRVSRRDERDQKKARELVHRRRCSKWPPLARTHAKLL